MLRKLGRRIPFSRFLLVITLIAGGLFLFGGGALAQTATDNLSAIGATAGFSETSLPVLIARIVRIALGVTGLILFVLIVYAGFLYMTARGESDQVDKAKRILTQAVIGMIIIFSAFAITQFVLNGLLSGAFGGGSGGSNQGGQSGIIRFSEPRSGSLGAGIIEDHYPGRNALDIPRNTSILVTFKEAINPASFIDGYTDGGELSGRLNTANVYIYPTADGPDAKLAPEAVNVYVDEAGKTLAFDPVDLLGQSTEDVNYTVDLRSTIELKDGSAAFAGRFAEGYAWSFEVSTVVDLTPPTVVSVQPRSDSSVARNTAVQVNFSEPMNPFSVAGIVGGNNPFTNIEVLSGSGSVGGTFTLSNNYHTVTFVSDSACAQDACGNIVYCLPGGDDIKAIVHAATVSTTPPQATFANGRFDGAVDVSGNSLDGNRNFSSSSPASTAEGRPDDDYIWVFTTTSAIDERTPQVASLSPDLDETFVNPDSPVEIAFNMPMLVSSLTSRAVQLFPDRASDVYEFPFWINSEDVASENGEQVNASKVFINHRTLVPADVEGGMAYWPLISSEVKGINQFCMYPSNGPEAPDAGPAESCGTSSLPYCCKGYGSQVACTTTDGSLPYAR